MFDRIEESARNRLHSSSYSAAGPDHHKDTLMGRRKVVKGPNFW